MSEPVVPPPPPSSPPPPPAEPPKKGLSTGAKVAIGCLVALLLLAGGCFVVTAFFVKKGVDSVKSFAEDVENNPEAAAVKAAELVARINPEIEVVSSDPEAGKITLREKRTGKVVTFNAEDIKNGKFSFESEGETTTIDADAGEGGEPGKLSIASGDRSMVFGADGASVPDWVPAYPGARADSFSTIESGQETSGTFTIHTSDAPEKVLAYFEAALDGAGYSVEKSWTESETRSSGNINATNGPRTVNVALAAQEGETQGLVAYSEKR